MLGGAKTPYLEGWCSMEESNQDNKAELGRRILGALISYKLGLKSIDYTMKTYLSDTKVDSSWGELGSALLQALDAGPEELRSLTDKVQ